MKTIAFLASLLAAAACFAEPDVSNPVFFPGHLAGGAADGWLTDAGQVLYTNDVSVKSVLSNVLESVTGAPGDYENVSNKAVTGYVAATNAQDLVGRKRDLDDLVVHEPANRVWVWTPSDGAPTGWIYKVSRTSHKPEFDGTKWAFPEIGGYSADPVVQPESATTITTTYRRGETAFTVTLHRDSATDTDLVDTAMLATSEDTAVLRAFQTNLWNWVYVETYDLRDVIENHALVITNSIYPELKRLSPLPTNTYTKAETDAKLSPIEAQVTSLQSGKRDKTDRDVYEWVETRSFTFEADNDELLADLEGKTVEYRGAAGWFIVGLPYYWDLITPSFLPEDADVLTGFQFMDGRTGAGPYSVTANVIREYELQTLGKLLSADNPLPASGSLAKFAADGKMVKAEPSGTSADPANADYRDPKDNTCHKTGFGEWTFSGSEYNPASTYRCEIVEIEGVERARLYINGVFHTMSPTDGVSAYFGSGFAMEGDAIDITATRTAVCTKDETLVTQSFVANEVAAAISTNNSAFVSAVRAIVDAMGSFRAYDRERDRWYRLQVVDGTFELAPDNATEE